MRNIVLIVEYDGSAYKGWQKQKNGLAIQEVMETAIYQITGEQVSLVASGRTDTGVHALGQVASFLTNTKIPAERLVPAINSKLPPDIVIQRSMEAPLSFSPRFDAKRKTYLYRIINSPQKSSIQRSYACHERVELDVKKMMEEGKHLLGEHDFTSFCSSGSQVDSKVREIFDLQIRAEALKEPSMNFPFDFSTESGKKNFFPPAIITIEVCGNGFLYNMVRIIAGTLIEIGKGNERYHIDDIIKKKDRAFAGPTAKPQGLFLKTVEYR